MPCAGRPNAVALGVDVEEIGPPVGDDALCADNRGLALAGLLDDFTLDPERAGRLGVVPSPTTATTGWSGRASLTPNAAAMPQPRMFAVVAKYFLSAPPNDISGSVAFPESTSHT
jgi:hypothetical protein